MCQVAADCSVCAVTWQQQCVAVSRRTLLATTCGSMAYACLAYHCVDTRQAKHPVRQ
jgi:hypothetical protein